MKSQAMHNTGGSRIIMATTTVSDNGWSKMAGAISGLFCVRIDDEEAESSEPNNLPAGTA